VSRAYIAMGDLIARLLALLSTLRDCPLTGQQDLYRRAGRQSIATMLLWGKHDPVTPIGQLDTVRELLGPDECHVVTDSGHMIPFEDPDGTARLLIAFFQQIITGGRST
jgi:pimeloyl-ACP methyl ester carboxylesterase